MTITARLYVNGDDCFLAWHMPPSDGCWGFALHRSLRTAAGKEFSGFVKNRTGFAGDKVVPNERRSSVEWPFQRYTWTDHGVSEGDEVTYTITPVVRANGGLHVDEAQSVTVGPARIDSSNGEGVSAYFNRGLILSQFVARALGPDWQKSDVAQLKEALRDRENELRAFLTGQLGQQILALLEQARAEGWHVYAALYELDDDALIEAMRLLGDRAHVVLANGSKKKKGEDGNAHAAEVLDGVVDLTRRMLWSKGLGHNKFVVFARDEAEPFLVWTGSMNWASTGMCTQINNGILIEDPDVARVYFDQWELLRDDEEPYFGESLIEANDEAKEHGKYTVWFTRTSEAQDMDYLAGLINGAQKAILFQMFEPGTNGLLQVIQARLSPASPTYDPGLYVQGVVNTRTGAQKDGVQPTQVELVGNGVAKPPFDLKIIQPEGVREGFAQWAAEVTRSDFILGQGGVIGHAIVHSKAIVIDPFTDPVVITGSHNFSASASNKNDENFVVIRGDRTLAERFLVNIMSVYQHYRWRAYLRESAEKGITPWQGLQKNDQWQRDLSSELSFWLS